MARNNRKRLNSSATFLRCNLCFGEFFTFLFDHHNNWKVQQCNLCGLVQVIPRPKLSFVTSLYHEDFEHFQPYIEQLPVHREYFSNKIREIRSKIRNIRSQKNLRLLDIGCALGVLLEEAEKEGMKAQGIDISAGAVNYCRKHGLHVEQGTLATRSKHFKQASIDVVTAFEIIEHEYDPLGMMKSVYSLLIPGGLAVVTTPNHGSIWRKIMRKWWFGYQHREHLYFFDEVSLKRLFTEAGFSSVEVWHETPRPFPLSFAITRSADYFPLFRWLLIPVGKVIERLNIMNPINPWDDLIVVGVK